MGVSGIIPDGRRIDWTNAGVPGGIPARSTTCAILSQSSTIADYGPIIERAIENCPPDQVILLNPGTFPIQSSILFADSSQTFHSRITIRGSGPERTVLVPSATFSARAVFDLGEDDPTTLGATVVGGATKGSTQLLLSTTTGLNVGSMIKIDRDDDPSLVHSTDGKNRHIGQLVMITSIDRDTITLSSPLFWDFTANPQLTLFPSVLTFVGIEDLAIDHASEVSGYGFSLDQCYGCWVLNVTTIKPPGYHLIAFNSLNCEIRDSFQDDSRDYGQDRAGILLYENNTAFKIENNIFYRTFPGVQLSNSSSANVIAYNYGTDVRVDPTWNMAAPDFDDNAGAHDMMNLYEGNVGVMFMSEGSNGSGSHATLFRNHFTATQPTYPTGNRQAISLKRWSYEYNVVGNVLGLASWPSDGLYEIEVDDYAYSIATIYQLGYPNIGNNSFMSGDGVTPPGLDSMVKGTLLRHGNFDFDHATTVWDPAIQDRTLPASLLYRAPPSFWPTATPWPPIGPDVSGLSQETPAQARAHQLGLP
jgi:hypothetical protein